MNLTKKLLAGLTAFIIGFVGTSLYSNYSKKEKQIVSSALANEKSGSTILTQEEIENHISRSTFRLLGITPFGMIAATGVVVRSGKLGSYLITNKHFCNPTRLTPFEHAIMGEVEEFRPSLILKDSSKIRGFVSAVDINADLCLVHFPDLTNAETMHQYSDGYASPGEKIVTIGFPGSYRSQQKYYGFAGKLDSTSQIFFHQKAEIHAEGGQSGSGIYRLNGDLIGLLNRGFPQEDGTHNNMNTALVPISDVKRFLCREIQVACQ